MFLQNKRGANNEQIKELDDGLKMLNAFLPRDIREVKGAGAAGGICGGLYSVYGGEIKSGFDILCEASSLEKKIKESDIVITGEGKTDNQTLMGKLVYKISELCKKYNKKCIILSGDIENVILGDKMYSLVDKNTSAEYAIENAQKLLYEKAKIVIKDINISCNK